VARRRTMFWTLFLATSLVVYLLVAVYHRLVPESSPVARGGATPGIYACLSCHGKNDDDAPVHGEFLITSRSVAGITCQGDTKG